MLIIRGIHLIREHFWEIWPWVALKKLTSVFHASVLVLMKNFVTTLSKQLCIHGAIYRGVDPQTTLTMYWRNNDRTNA